MRILLLQALALVLASTSTADKQPVCSKDRLDGSWSRRVPFETSAHIHYTNEDRNTNASLTFYIKERWRNIFAVRIYEGNGTLALMEFELYNKEGKKEVRQSHPYGYRTLKSTKPQIVDICLVDDHWKVKLTTKPNDTWQWVSPVAVYEGNGSDLSLQSFSTTPYAVELPCGYPDCPEELVEGHPSKKWRVRGMPVILQCTVLERSTPADFNFLVEENLENVATVKIQIQKKIFMIEIDSAGREKTCSFDPREGEFFFRSQKPQVVEVTYAEGRCKVRLRKADSYEWIECSSDDVPTNGTGDLALQVQAKTTLVVKLPCGHQDVADVGGLRTHHILTIICLTLVALILLACCVRLLLARRGRRRFTPIPRKSSISKT